MFFRNTCIGCCCDPSSEGIVFSFQRRRRRNKSEGAAHSEGDRVDPHSSSFEIDSEMDFPTLGSSCDSKVMLTLNLFSMSQMKEVQSIKCMDSKLIAAKLRM